MRLVVLLLALTAIPGHAPGHAHAGVVHLHDNKGAVYLSGGKGGAAMLEDPAGTMTIDQVAASRDFGKMRTTPSFTSAYWIRIAYTTANTTQPWYLFLGYKADTANLYLRNPDGTYTVERSGLTVPYADRPSKRLYGAILFLLPQAAKPETVYVRLTTREPDLTIAIDSQSTVDGVRTITFTVVVALTAIILSLLISAIIYYAASRDAIYLLFAVYIFLELLYRANDQGFLGTIFWPHAGISSLRLGVLFDGARIIAATVFLRAFLNLHAVSRLVDYLNIIFAATFGMLAIACFAQLPVRASLLSELSLVYVPLWLVSALVAWLRGQRQALLIAVGWSLYMIFSVSFGLKELGIGRGNLVVELLISHGRSLGVALQTLFLSLAISTDIRRLMRSEQYYSSLASTDPLTGLSNRRTFEEQFQREWSRAQRAGSILSLLIVDVDFFKDYNEVYGHAGGDAALRFVVERAKSTMRRGGDLFSRYGGDEFVVLLPDSDETHAMAAATRIHDAIIEKPLPNTGSPHGMLTVSIGVATLRPTETGVPKELFDLADSALYVAKAQGRNACVAAGASSFTPA